MGWPSFRHQQPKHQPRQRLARIPLALPEVKQSALSEAVVQPPQEISRSNALRRAHRRRVPLGAVAIVDRHERRLAPHRQPDVRRLKLAIDRPADRIDRSPLGVGVRPRDARQLMDAANRHRELEVGADLFVAAVFLGEAEGAGDRCRALRIGGASERNVSLAGEQAGRRIETDPAGAGEIDLRPGVEIGEVARRTAWALDRLLVGDELDQVAGDEPGRQPKMTEELHQQPGSVPTGAALERQRRGAGLDARLEADDVADVLVEPLIDGDEEIDRRLGRLRQHGADELVQSIAALADFEIGSELFLKVLVVAEGRLLRGLFKEEVERIDRDHLSDEIDLDSQPVGRLREDEPRAVVAVRILLPVDEVLGRLDLQRVREDLSPAMRGGPQADNMRQERDRAIVQILGDVIEGDANRHRTLRNRGYGPRPLARRASEGRFCAMNSLPAADVIPFASCR